MCAVSYFSQVLYIYYNNNNQQQRYRPSLNPVAIAHVFLAEGVGGASITSDRGSAQKKGRECSLQPMDEERAKPRRSSQWEARRPETTEPLRGAGHRHITRPMGGRVQDGSGRITSGRIHPTSQEGLNNCRCDPSGSSRLVWSAGHLPSWCWLASAVLVPWRLVRSCPCGFESHHGGWSVRSSQALPQESQTPQGQVGKPCERGQLPAEL